MINKEILVTDVKSQLTQNISDDSCQICTRDGIWRNKIVMMTSR